MSDSWSYLPGTGDAWERMAGSSGDAWSRLPGPIGDAWERLTTGGFVWRSPGRGMMLIFFHAFDKNQIHPLFRRRS